MTAILPAGMDDSSAYNNSESKRRQMSKPPERRVNAPWADAVFALLAKSAAASFDSLYMVLLLHLVGNLA